MGVMESCHESLLFASPNILTLESRYRTRFSNTGSQPNYNTNPNSNLKPNPALTLIGLEQHTQGLTLTFTELVSTIIFLYPSTLDIYMI